MIAKTNFEANPIRDPLITPSNNRKKKIIKKAEKHVTRISRELYYPTGLHLGIVREYILLEMIFFFFFPTATKCITRLFQIMHGESS